MGYNRAPEKKKAEPYRTPSSFGSHKSMVATEEQGGDDTLHSQLEMNGMVLLFDEKGLYITYPERLDSGFADTRRYSGDRFNA
tara:strand:- start:352 stop:600 length:249 start_codon:yes stop_codon:yes gene_type:complete